VTPERRQHAIEWARVVFSWRDVCSIFAIVWLLWLIKSDLRDLNTHFVAYQESQAREIINLQHQVDEWRAMAKLAYDTAKSNEAAVARIDGFLAGSNATPGKGAKK
jgi:hypothetical protein